MSYRPDICIYHDNCDDGFAAAWVIHELWGDVDFRPCNYGQAVPGQDIDGKHILILDFSFDAETLIALAGRAASVLVLDHHKTAQEALADLPSVADPSPQGVADYLADEAIAALREARSANNLLVEFDMERSGARMAWDFCWRGCPPPTLILSIEDRDLWRFEREDTKRVSLYLRSLDRDFAQWSSAMERYDDDRAQFLSEAAAVERFYIRRVAEMADSATVQTFAGHKNVPVVHVPYAFVSDACHMLLNLHPEAPFAVAIVKAHGGTTCSLRSADDREDVSAIARKYGGGGHRNAAGFRLPL